MNESGTQMSVQSPTTTKFAFAEAKTPRSMGYGPASSRTPGAHGEAPANLDMEATHAEAHRACIPVFELDVGKLPEQTQFDTWRHNFAPMVELTAVDGDPAHFAGKQKTWDLGPIAFTHIKSDELRFASIHGHTRREPVDHWAMTLVLEGNIETSAPGGSFRGGAGRIQVHPLAGFYEGHITDSEMLMLFVPRDFCPEVARVLSAIEFSTIDTGMGQLLSEFLLGLAKRLANLDVSDLGNLAAATRAMILACASPTADSIREAEEPISMVLLEKARRLVQHNLFDSHFCVETLRRELAVSRTRLYRLFEPYGGVAHYLQRRRLIDAHAVLADPCDQRRIVDIAEQRCFTDGAEFSRAFRREFGYTPSDVRAGIHGGVPSRPATDLAANSPEERFGLLLRKLHG